jgi:signal transduction histidine kinase
LKRVSQEIKRLSRLVTTMLNLARLEDGVLKPVFKPLEMRDLLLTIAFSFTQIAQEKNISIEGLDNLPDITLLGDSDMLHQVFYNLLDNAIKFSPPGQRIEFRAVSSIPPPALAFGGEISYLFSIKNYGIGIAANERQRVFERFYKLDTSRSYDIRSAGLGLFLVKLIVERHGGKIKVFSDNVHYTEFALMLPFFPPSI